MTDNEVKWLIVGKLLRRNLMAAKKEPVAYSYNGVRLPKLPEWDKTAYPYAVIASYIESITLVKKYRLTIFQNEADVFPSHGMISASGRYAVATCSASDTEWGEFTEYNATFSATSLAWSNCDLKDTEGTLMLAATDPMPIYE